MIEKGAGHMPLGLKTRLRQVLDSVRGRQAARDQSINRNTPSVGTDSSGIIETLLPESDDLRQTDPHLTDTMSETASEVAEQSAAYAIPAFEARTEIENASGTERAKNFEVLTSDTDDLAVPIEPLFQTSELLAASSIKSAEGFEELARGTGDSAVSVEPLTDQPPVLLSGIQAISESRNSTRTLLVDFGLIAPYSSAAREIEVETASEAQVRSLMDGLKVEPTHLLTPGRHRLRLSLDFAALIPQSIIEAELTVETGGGRFSIRIIGEVDADSGVSSKSSLTISDEPWRLQFIQKDHVNRANTVAFGSGSAVLVSGAEDGTVRWHRLDDNTDISPSMKFSSEVKRICMSRDSKYLAVGLRNGTIHLIENDGLETRWVQQWHPGYISSLAFSPDAKLLVAGTGSKCVDIIETTTGALVRSIAHEGVVTCVTVAGSGLVFASATQVQNKILLWETLTGKPLRPLVGHTGIITSLAFSLDGYLLASGSFDKTVRIWDTQTAQRTSIISDLEGMVFAVAMSPNGQLVATASSGPKARVWQLSSGKQLAHLEQGQKKLNSLVFSNDGKYLAGASDDFHVYVWLAGR